MCGLCGSRMTSSRTACRSSSPGCSASQTPFRLIRRWCALAVEQVPFKCMVTGWASRAWLLWAGHVWLGTAGLQAAVRAAQPGSARGRRAAAACLCGRPAWRVRHKDPGRQRLQAGQQVLRMSAVNKRGGWLCCVCSTAGLASCILDLLAVCIRCGLCFAARNLYVGISCLPDNVQMLTCTAALHTGSYCRPLLRQRQSAVLDLFPELTLTPPCARFPTSLF